jgi:hypothetical protein
MLPKMKLIDGNALANGAYLLALGDQLFPPVSLYGTPKKQKSF